MGNDMSEKCKVKSYIDESGSFRVYLVVSTAMVEEARKIHDTTPLATAGLGRVLTGAALMGLQLKSPEDKLTVRFQGDGPAGEILATSYGDGRVKGYISDPSIDLPLKGNSKLDVGGSLGTGSLTVIKDMGLKEPYVGTIALVSGEIAEDLTAYYYISEQQNTSIALGVKIDVDRTVRAAGGMFLQMLPGARESAIDELEPLLGSMLPITTLIDDAVSNGEGKTQEGILDDIKDAIFGSLSPEHQLRDLGTYEVCWECDCSRERLRDALAAIGKKDLTEIIEEDGQAELLCHFCNKKYMFDKEELLDILSHAV